MRDLVTYPPLGRSGVSLYTAGLLRLPGCHAKPKKPARVPIAMTADTESVISVSWLSHKALEPIMMLRVRPGSSHRFRLRRFLPHTRRHRVPRRRCGSIPVVTTPADADKTAIKSSRRSVTATLIAVTHTVATHERITPLLLN